MRWVAAHGIESVQCSAQVDVGKIGVGIIVVAHLAVESWWQCVLECLVEEWCFCEGGVCGEVLV